MATSDKVQKLSGEAFHKLKSDHEQFLEAYEKPTQIYRFLKARHSLRPLFLHRNLSYMRMHRQASEAKQKRKRRLRVDDLVKHIIVNKPDLATEIKSDNHLKISFSGLEDGIDFNTLLADANDTQSTNQNRASKSHDSQQVEIEVLLYSFNQPSAEALLSGNKNSFRCSCSSLGKRVIQYDVGCSNDLGSKSKNYQPFSIPESSLTWKHRQGIGGTQMIVFRASQYSTSTSPRANTKKKRVRKNGIHEAKNSEAVTSGFQSSSNTTSSASTGSSAVDLQRTLLTDVMTGESVAVPTSMELHSQLRARDAAGKKSKPKPETKDACVMTDIRFGTDVINELAPIYQSQFSSVASQNTSTSSLHNGTTLHSKKPPKSSHCRSTSPDKSPKSSRCRSSSPDRSREDKCTSPLIPKLSLRNGMLNGYTTMNGYAAPTVTAVRQNVKKRKKIKRKLAISTKSKNVSVLSLVQPVSKPKALPIKKLGSGKQGTHSFLVSIPRKHFSGKSPPAVDPVTRCNGGSKNLRSPRRTEIQLLLDGDKPPGQRMTPDQIPKFTAEDVTSWSTSSTEKSTWLESSTRRIMPVEPYNYPLSPKKLTNGSSVTTLPPTGDRKRAHSEESEQSAPVSPKPPPKCSRLSTSEDASVAKVPPSPLSPSMDKQLVPMADQPGSPPVPVQSKNPAQSSASSQDTTEDLRIQSNEVFCAELAVFDSRGDCLLRDGEYAVLMQQCLQKEEREPSDLLVFEPLTWSSVFAGTTKTRDSLKKSRNLLLKFSLSWSDGPPQHLLCSNLDTALDLKKIRESYHLPKPPRVLTPLLPPDTTPTEPTPSLSDPEPLPLEQDMDIPSVPTTENSDTSSVPMDVTMATQSLDTVAMTTQAIDGVAQATQPMDVVARMTQSMENGKVFFNFLYGNNSLQQTESQDDMRCPWCFIQCQTFYSFLKHMSLCHPRFQFTYSPRLHRAKVIDVHVNKLYDTSSSIERDPGERDSVSLVRRRQRPAKCFSCTCVLVDRGVDVEEDLSEFMNDGSWRRGYNTNRMYYHSNSCLPMLEDEIKVDSEEEESALEWQKICCQKMLDDFTDVNKGEKRLMKLWNLFVMEHKLIAEKQIPTASLLFAQENRDKLLREKIDRNFLSHLISLFDFGLISSATIRQCMSAIYEPLTS